MVLSFLFVLATPRMGPPPNVGPLKPLEFGDEDPDPGEDEFEFPPGPEELLEDEPPEEEFPESLFVEFCEPPGPFEPADPPNPL
jgi:hypothetical protein